MNVEAESISREFLSLIASLINTESKHVDEKNIRSAVSKNQWPRNPTEKLISAYFERPLDQFVAVLEALRSVLAAAPVFASVEAIKAVLDTNVCEVIEELFLAGFSILCPNQHHTLARFRGIYENSQKSEEGPESRLMLLDFKAVDAYAYATPDFLMNAFDEESDVQSDAPNPVPRTNLRGLLDFMKMCLAYDQYDIFECLHDNANYSLKVN
ncbi:unnamed protein product [Dibothriocephalus latus]|uniref:Uncharacterized protein n=1 Tax=Dibothriocephalus latus TaxID=60516 RepID=A0A3P7NUM7_DIBLA|nr:unnamed protein product [Dibothriocephalus latus]